jgi:ribosomal protein S18 acetylase RimI-like enzyme
MGGASVVDGLLGLFAIDTLSAYRRKGWAMQVIGRLARGSSDRGATRVFLQVSADNEPALALYEKLGFSRLNGNTTAPAPASAFIDA